MSDEKEKSGQCGWIAFAFFMVFLQAYLPLGIIGGVSALKLSGKFYVHPGAPDLLARFHILIGIVSALLLSAVLAMIFALGLSAAAAKFFARIKKILQRRAVFHG